MHAVPHPVTHDRRRRKSTAGDHGGHERRSNSYRRRAHYIDETIQKWLIVCMVLLEIGLVAGLSWLLHRQLNQIVEDNLFRVHLANAAPLLTQLVHAALPLLALFLFVNAVVLLFVYLAWHRYLDQLLAHFLMLIDKTRRLDFSADPRGVDYSWQLLVLTEAQRAQERRRLLGVRMQLLKLKHEVANGNDTQSMRHTLVRLEASLPPQVP